MPKTSDSVIPGFNVASACFTCSCWHGDNWAVCSFIVEQPNNPLLKTSARQRMSLGFIVGLVCRMLAKKQEQSRRMSGHSKDSFPIQHHQSMRHYANVPEA